MRIRLNGDPHELAAPLTIAALLDSLGIDARRVAVEHNLTVVKRADYDKTMVEERDEIEIVNFVGGGSPELHSQTARRIATAPRASEAS